MRFITLSALFLFASTTLAAPLDLLSRQEDTYSSLVLRDDVADIGAAIGVTARSDFDDENWLERRISRAKKIANKAARTLRKTAAKAEVAQASQKAMKKLGKTAVRTAAGRAAAKAAGKQAAQAKKQELKTAAHTKHLQMKAAGVEHRKTTGLPGRNQKFTVPAGNGKPERTYTGKDVRKANFGSHIKNTNGNRFGKPFANSDHIDPGRSGTTKPIPGMVGAGHEHPLSGATTHSQMRQDNKKEPARIVSQTTASGHRHMGVIAHVQSRPSTHPGATDHFKVNPT
jgi:hypothetical protein